jgi:hypothetical protein
MADAAAPLAQGNDQTPAGQGVFAGQRFFVLSRVPQRSRFVEQIQANGGRVVKIESNADHVIADHCRKDCPAGSLSFEFITAAITTGQLPDPDQHRAGPPPGTIRPAGFGIPGKTTRTPFTAEDDRILWDWVQSSERKGGKVKGNDLYKQLEQANPRHTFQAWRDRYLKKLVHHPPTPVQVRVPANPPPSPPTAPDQLAERAGPASRTNNAAIAGLDGTSNNNSLEYESLPEDDIEALLLNADSIEDIDPSRVDEAWDAFAEQFGRHSGEMWRKIWYEQARAIYLKRNTERENEGDPSKDDKHESVVKVRETAHGHDGPQMGGESKTVQRGQGQRQFLNQTDEGIDDMESASEKDSQRSGLNKRKRTSKDQDSTKRRKRGNHERDEDATLAFQTSELNREAEGQIYREQQPKPNINLPSDVIQTSEANHAADDQLRRESGSRTHLPMDREGDDDGIVHEQTLLGSTANHTILRRAALTEANLASQQAQQGRKSLRATDLIIDDDDAAGAQRQDVYAAELQQLLQQDSHVEAPVNVTTHTLHNKLNPDVELPSRALVGAYQDENFHDPGGLPMSTDQEIDDAVDDFINWPESPNQSQRKQAQRPTQSHSQVEYPSLPLQDKLLSHDDETWHDDSHEAPQEPHYPVLPSGDQRAASKLHIMEDASEEGDIKRHEQTRPSQQAFDGDGKRSFPVAEELPSNSAQIGSNAIGRVFAEARRRLIGSEEASEESPEDQDDEDEEVYEQEAQSQPAQGGQPQNVEVISSDSLSSSDDEAYHQPALETQDILNAETQLPDLTIPLPDDSENAASDSSSESSNQSSAARNESPEPSSSQQMHNEEMNIFIQNMVIRYGCSEASVIKALTCTTNSPDLAQLVLLEEKLGNGIPDDVAGIWTDEDDRQLQGADANALKRLEQKHGYASLTARFEFLGELSE